MIGAINNSIYLSISRNLQKSSRQIGESLQRISSGNRFVDAGDEPALQGFVSKLDSQIRGMNQAVTGINTAKGAILQAEDALSGMADIAIRLKDLALQASNDNLSSAERSILEAEASELLAAFSDFSSDTTFNGRNLLTGSYENISVQTGPNAGNNFSFSIGDARSTTTGGLAIYSNVGSISSAIGASAATTLSLNGVSIGASTSDGLSSKSADSSALAIVNAINDKSSETGVTAEVTGTERTLYVDFGVGGYLGSFEAGDFELNDITFSGTISDVGAFVTALNSKSSSTGVIASVDGNKNVSLVAEDGRNIVVDLSGTSSQNVYAVFDLTDNNSFFSSGPAAGELGLAQTGGIEIYSSSAISISGGASVSQTLGLSAGSYAMVSGTSTANIDLSTQENAERALKILDSTIDDISTLRAEIGAVHDRLDMTAETLLQGSNSLEDTRTAVAGTDFANEIAKLVSAQLLQDASVASLAQANSQASVVSELLSELRD